MIQTGRVLDDTRFATWNGRRDPSHIVFFADASFAWLAARWGAVLALPHRAVAVLVKANRTEWGRAGMRIASIVGALGLVAALGTTAAWAKEPVPEVPPVQPQIAVEVLTRTSKSWDGSALPTYPRATPEITILRIRIAPGATLPVHKHPFINAGVMLQGQLTVTSEAGDTLHLKAGDTIVELVEKWHFGRNDGDTMAELVVFYAGIGGLPVTVRQDAAQPGYGQ